MGRRWRKPADFRDSDSVRPCPKALPLIVRKVIGSDQIASGVDVENT
jgi:hypothetical protein